MVAYRLPILLEISQIDNLAYTNVIG